MQLHRHTTTIITIITTITIIIIIIMAGIRNIRCANELLRSSTDKQR
jgi:hypothetical protein